MTSPEVKQARTTWGETVTTPGSVRGGSTSALLTDFGDAGKPMFASSPGCSLEHQASFRLGDYRNISRGDGKPAPGKDFTFFPFPGFGATPAGLSEVSADLAAMFKPSDNALKLMSYLADVRATGVTVAR